MSDNVRASATGGIGFTGLLAILFIAFKLLHVIDWSWWWVLAPLWAFPVGLMAFGIGFFAVYMGAIAADKITWWRRRRKGIVGRVNRPYDRG